MNSRIKTFTRGRSVKSDDCYRFTRFMDCWLCFVCCQDLFTPGLTLWSIIELLIHVSLCLLVLLSCDGGNILSKFDKLAKLLYFEQGRALVWLKAHCCHKALVTSTSIFDEANNSVFTWSLWPGPEIFILPSRNELFTVGRFAVQKKRVKGAILLGAFLCCLSNIVFLKLLWIHWHIFRGRLVPNQNLPGGELSGKDHCYSFCIQKISCKNDFLLQERIAWIAFVEVVSGATFLD